MINNIRFSLILGLILAAFCIPSTASAGINQWTAIGPESGLISALAIDPLSPSTIVNGQLE